MSRGKDLMEVPEGWGFVKTMDRRDFLKLTGSGLLVVCSVDPLLGQAGPAPTAQRAATDINSFLHIGADGRVTCLVGKVELGQGVMTSLPQLAAEELGVPLSAVDIVMGDTDLCPMDRGTFGSLSIRMFGPTLRAAAAEARAVLVQMAAERLRLPVTDLEVRDGVVISKTDPSKRMGYGALAAGKRIERRLDGQAVLKQVSAFTIMGRSAPRRDALEKVTGKAKYAGDIAPSGALHACILRPPSHGAKLLRADTAAAEAVPGVRVVHDGDLVAVLHAHRDEAARALALVKATYSPSPSRVTHETIFEHLQKVAPEARPTGTGGNLAAGEKSAAQVVEQTYLKGYVAHAPIETHSAVAMVENGKVTVWAGTQTPFPLKTQIARALNIAPEKVRVITPYVGGGFGGKSASMQGIEAARLAMATGKPVRVVWSREEEFFFDTFDPAAVIKIRAGLDAAKKIVFWDNTIIGAGDRGSALFYEVPNHRTAVRGGWNANPAGMHPFAIGPWRAPGANANVFARESHIDVMAAKAGMDPVEFRLRNLTDARMRRVLEAAAKQFGWTPKPAPSGRGVGVACGDDAGTYVATMAEVKVDKATGKVQVVRVVCAQDMGIVVNPEGAVQQMEGCITMGLGYTLAEEVRFKDGVVLDTNFGTYELPRFSDVPRIETVILDSPDLAPQGGGEPAIVTTGAVLANAVFDAVGARVVQLPMTPTRVKSAMKG
ncbi:MAG: xanthine dehydrogenase family protein molybdopterin-binding subunit [Holophagaceae bacterium]|nr:xanthine dehydrogenase family protein molybdopterin-binding subunit [Holophagaceae bacterium]